MSNCHSKFNIGKNGASFFMDLMNNNSNKNILNTRSSIIYPLKNIKYSYTSTGKKKQSNYKEFIRRKVRNKILLLKIKNIIKSRLLQTQRSF